MKKFFSLLLMLTIVLSGCSAPDIGGAVDSAPISKEAEPMLLTSVTYPESISVEDYKRKGQVAEENAVDDIFKQNMNAFALKTASSTINDGENLNYSPASLYFALSLAAKGADKETLAELCSLLNIAPSDLPNIKKLYNLLYTDNEVLKLKIANSLWLDPSYTFKDEFITAAQDDHYAQVYSADLSGDLAAKEMGKWISKHTNGTLEPEIQISPEAMLSIINTVYFNGKWTAPFQKEQTEEGTFHAAAGDVEVDFMNKSSAGAAVKNDEYQKTSLAFNEGAMMTFIMPTNGTSANELLRDTEKLASIIDAPLSAFGTLNLSLPKFTFNTDIDAKKALENIGITQMFSKADADFSKISDTPAYVSEIKQGTYIALDEEGVEASAYTMMMMNATSAPPQNEETLVFDRPFIYTITYDDIILFMGIVENPAS